MAKSPINKQALRKAGGKSTNALSKATRAHAVSPEHDWQVEEAMRTLMRADELKRDTRLMADVKKLAAAQAAKMATICKK